MEEQYERQLESVVAAMPDGGFFVLVATIETDQAAALASDFAQLVGRSRTGHTLLVSLEGDPATLDHEIGVEGGPGLTQVLAGESTVASVAAHGRARGYIFVPAGGAAAPAAELLRAPAFARLASNATSRGGVVLAFVTQRALADRSPPDVDGVVWLGPEPDPAAVPTGWSTVGVLLPPGSTAAEPSPVPREPVPSEPVPVKVAAPRQGADPRRSKALRKPLVAALLTAVLVVAAALTVFLVSRSRGTADFLPENDSLWLRSPAGAADSAIPPDSIP